MLSTCALSSLPPTIALYLFLLLSLIFETVRVCGDVRLMCYVFSLLCHLAVSYFIMGVHVVCMCGYV